MKVTSSCSRSFVDKKYEGILKEIYEKRKESMRIESLKTAIKTREYNDDLYSKNIRWKNEM